MNPTQTLKRMTSVSLLAATVAISFTGTSRAEAQASTQKPITLQIGAGYLIDKTARNFTNSTGIHAGIGYDMASMNQGQTKGRTSIDLDYNYNSGNGNKLGVVGLGVTQRIPFSTNKSTTGGMQPYYGVGLGFAQIQSHNSPGSAANNSAVPTSSKTTHFASRFMAGLDFGGAFAELCYALNGSVNGVKADNVSLSLGMHF